ncbi:MAG: ABC transporter permease [Hyphomicrobiales bacterium]
MNYAIKRIGLAVLIIFLVMLAMYAMVFLVPGDPASLALGPRATPELKQALMVRMGLDKPIYVQVWNFFRNGLTGDLGYDVWSKRPVLDMILEVFPQTLFLGAVALGTAVVLGIGLGCLAVVWRGTWGDRILAIISVSLISIPSFVIGIYLLLVFAVWLGWLPAIGAGKQATSRASCRPSSCLLLPSASPGLATLQGWCALPCWR